MNKQFNQSWFVYILECADGTFYTGITTNLERRIAEHNANEGKGARYTRSRLPVRLVYSEKCLDRSCASQREAQIKLLSRDEKLRLMSKKT